MLEAILTALGNLERSLRRCWLLRGPFGTIPGHLGRSRPRGPTPPRSRGWGLGGDAGNIISDGKERVWNRELLRPPAPSQGLVGFVDVAKH
eukprot:1656220-Pyramimonas_sp.AAC.1